MRKIASMLVDNRSAFLSYSGVAYEYLGDPVNTLSILRFLDIDEVVIFDITTGRNGIDCSLLKEYRRSTDIPISTGGGIITMKNAEEAFSCGIDRAYMSLRSWSAEVAEFIICNYGRQALGGALDVSGSKEELVPVIKNGRSVYKMIDSCNIIAEMMTLCSDLIVNDLDCCGCRFPRLESLNKFVANLPSSESSSGIPNIIIGGGFGIKDHVAYTNSANSLIKGIAYSRSLYMQSNGTRSVLVA